MNFNKLKGEEEFNEMVNKENDNDENVPVTNDDNSIQEKVVLCDLGKVKKRLSNTIRDIQIVFCPTQETFIVGQITPFGPIGTGHTIVEALNDYLEIQEAIVENHLLKQL